MVGRLAADHSRHVHLFVPGYAQGCVASMPLSSVRKQCNLSSFGLDNSEFEVSERVRQQVPIDRMAW
jgi:hypothetical protein